MDPQSIHLRKLVSQLYCLEVPGEESHRKAFVALRRPCEEFVALPGMHRSEHERRIFISMMTRGVRDAAQVLGAEHEAVVLVRQMLDLLHSGRFRAVTPSPPLL